MKRILKLAVYGIVAISILSSCTDSDDYPSQKDIETKIIGKWKEIVTEGKDALTNSRTIRTFYTGNKATHSCSRIYDGNYAWYNKSPFKYEVSGCDMCESSEENSFKTFSKVMSIDESKLSANYYKEILPEGQERGININAIYQKVAADYSRDIIGLWEGVEMTGDETYGDANHRIEYKADGTYVYYDKDGDNWKPSENVDNEYNVDGDWLATRWRPAAGADYEYEWWDIAEIKDGTMKWSALREKGDKTRYTTTFTWKKIQLQ